MRRPPKYTFSFVDRHGKARFYLRRAGYKLVPLPGLPWSPEFMEAYEDALAGQPRAQIAAKRSRPGTINALVAGFYTSIEYQSLAKSTKRTYRNVIERFRTEHGDKRVALLKAEHIRRIIALKVSTPAAAKDLLKTIRLLMAFAVAEGMREDNPALSVKAPKIRSEGFHTWTEDEIGKFERTHPIGTRARLAFALLLYTAQRRGDVVRMGRQHIRNGALFVRQEKTGAQLEIPLHTELKQNIDVVAPDQLTFLVTEYGRPFSPAGFGNWFRDRCNEADLRHCSAHGLRKAASRRLAEAGCTAHQIAAITGHKTLAEVQRYTSAVDQGRLAASAMKKI